MTKPTTLNDDDDDVNDDKLINCIMTGPQQLTELPLKDQIYIMAVLDKTIKHI